MFSVRTIIEIYVNDIGAVFIGILLKYNFSYWEHLVLIDIVQNFQNRAGLPFLISQ